MLSLPFIFPITDFYFVQHSNEPRKSMRCDRKLNRAGLRLMIGKKFVGHCFWLFDFHWEKYTHFFFFSLVDMCMELRFGWELVSLRKHSTRILCKRVKWTCVTWTEARRVKFLFIFSFGGFVSTLPPFFSSYVNNVLDFVTLTLLLGWLLGWRRNKDKLSRWIVNEVRSFISRERETLGLSKKTTESAETSLCVECMLIKYVKSQLECVWKKNLSKKELNMWAEHLLPDDDAIYINKTLSQLKRTHRAHRIPWRRSSCRWWISCLPL